MRYRIRPYSFLSVALFTLEVFGVGAVLVGVAYAVVLVGGWL